LQNGINLAAVQTNRNQKRNTFATEAPPQGQASKSATQGHASNLATLRQAAWKKTLVVTPFFWCKFRTNTPRNEVERKPNFTKQNKPNPKRNKSNIKEKKRREKKRKEKKKRRKEEKKRKKKAEKEKKE
jgi:hypothetical protein